jgi:hypothetical protein
VVGLLYAVWIGQTIAVTATHPFNSKDLSITSVTPWNLALVINDREHPENDLFFSTMGAPGTLPFNSTSPPVVIRGKARVVQGWGTVKHAPDAPPASPACAQEGACGDEIDVVLVPFGTTHVRMAVLPTA